MYIIKPHFDIHEVALILFFSCFLFLSNYYWSSSDFISDCDEEAWRRVFFQVICALLHSSLLNYFEASFYIWSNIVFAFFICYFVRKRQYQMKLILEVNLQDMRTTLQ